jgi:uncharacterized protein (TIRG00374 family)
MRGYVSAAYGDKWGGEQGDQALLKPWLYWLAGVCVSVLFVYLAVRNVNLSEAIQVLQTVRPVPLGAAVVTYLVAYPVRALRWRLLLQAQKTLSWKEILVPVFVGYMANNLLPARAGEIYRAHFLGRRTRMSRSRVVGSIVVERTFDGLMLISLILLLFVLFPQARFLSGVTLAIGLVFLALAAGILFYGFTVDGTHQAIDKILGVLPQRFENFINRRLKSFLQGVRGVATVRGCLKAVVYTVLIWALEISAVALIVISFGVKLPLSGFLLVYALAALSTVLPSGPAYIGPFQYAFVLALGFFAISQEMALAISIAAQFALLGSVTIIGMILLLREQLRTGPMPSRRKPERG